jgi:hypothetical protein
MTEQRKSASRSDCVTIGDSCFVGSCTKPFRPVGTMTTVAAALRDSLSDPKDGTMRFTLKVGSLFGQ